MSDSVELCKKQTFHENNWRERKATINLFSFESEDEWKHYKHQEQFNSPAELYRSFIILRNKSFHQELELNCFCFFSESTATTVREGFSAREGSCKFSIENILGSLDSPPPPPQHEKDLITYTDISEDEVDVDEEDSEEDSPLLRWLSNFLPPINRFFLCILFATTKGKKRTPQQRGFWYLDLCLHGTRLATSEFLTSNETVGSTFLTSQFTDIP